MSMPYHSIKSKMWGSKNGTYREILRTYGDGTAIVASYLMTSPHARQSGLYSCPISYIASETERSAADVEQCLHNLEEIHFCRYDFEEEVVWIFTMVEYQLDRNWTKNKSAEKPDNRFKGVLNTLVDIKTSCLLNEFCTFWDLDLDASGGVGPLETREDNRKKIRTPSKGLTRGFDKKGSPRASKGLHGGDS